MSTEHPHNHSHDHGHDHDHSGAPKQPDTEDRALTYHAAMADAVADLLIAKGVFNADELRAKIETMQSRTPALGAKVVARAWVDDGFKQRLIQDGSSAVAELGLDPGPAPLTVVENTAETHNVIVCTLCSCYPVFLLGKSPDWYKSREYRSRVVREPRTVLAEFGTDIAEDQAVRVHDSTADLRYMVLPCRPEGTENLSESELTTLVTRDSLIGVIECKSE